MQIATYVTDTTDVIEILGKTMTESLKTPMSKKHINGYFMLY